MKPQHRFPHLAQRLFNTPLALHPHKAEVVMAAIGERFGVMNLTRSGVSAPGALADFDEDDEPATYRAYAVQGRVAIIPIEGTLVQKLGTMRPYSGMTGYDGIRANLAQALDDPGVSALLLDIDSGGGEVSGLFDLVDAIYGARGEKPIWAVLDESAYSAAYAIASAADRVLIPRTGGAGSVGVICMHVDMSQALDKAGLSVTLITYGALKAQGSEMQPLEPDALARVQANIDAIGELFVSTVARNRGLPAATVRETEAGTFMGQAAVNIGFADAVASPQAALSALQAVL